MSDASVITEHRVILKDSEGTILTVKPIEPEDDDGVESWALRIEDAVAWASPEALRALAEQILAVLDGDA